MKTTIAPGARQLPGKVRRVLISIMGGAIFRRGIFMSSARFGIVFFFLVSAALYTITSASSHSTLNSSLPTAVAPDSHLAKASTGQQRRMYAPSLTGPVREELFRASGGSFFPLLPALPLEESVVIYKADCNTPQTVFNLGDTVCAKVTNAQLRTPALRRLTWSKGVVRQSQDVTTDPQTDLFTLPAANTSVIDSTTITNLGTWGVSLNSTSDNSTRAIAYFNVSDPGHAAADLAIYNFSTDSANPVAPGQNTGFFLFITNNGPDDANNVHVTQATPPNMSFVSTSQQTGPTFNCTHSGSITDCSIASLPSGTSATLTINYTVSPGAPNSTIFSRADISSDTAELSVASNTSDAAVSVSSPGGSTATCSLSCPSNIIVPVSTTQGGQDGAFVTFSTGDVEVSGDCGAITASPVSGSFFPVGITSVSVTSAAGGGACGFTVEVINATAPTITCPLSDLTGSLSAGQSEAVVNTTPPAATGIGVLVTGSRSDNRDLSDLYPIGTTIISWTATDTNQQTASCTQRVIVTAPNAPTISCPSDKSFNAPGGCSMRLTAGDIGAPTATGSNVTVVGLRNDGLVLTDPFRAGQTTITWTATDDLGRVVSCTQTITVTPSADTTPPTLHVPADVTVNKNSCSAILDEQQFVATAEDDCSAVTITSTGIPTTIVMGNPVPTFEFPAGTTIITYTATDSAGNIATGQQRVTVTESTPPTITAPADAIYDCLSQVPAASPGQATASDNCGSPAVTVSQTDNGGAGSAGSPLIITRTFTAKDASNNTANAIQTITVIDATPPTVSLTGATPITVECHTSFADPGATASDNCTGSLPVTTTVRNTSNTVIPGVDVNTPGTYTITYSATDAAGNSASETRTVNVTDTLPPAITLLGANPMTVECHTSFNDPGATASDSCAGDLTSSISVTGTVDVNVPGTYTLTYTVTDGNGHSATSTRTVNVADTQPPAITLLGANPMTVECHTSFNDPGATASDSCAGNLTSSISVIGTVNVNVPGTYTLTYTVTDGNGHSATSTRTVNVVDTQPPAITLLGANPMTVECHTSFNDPGATASDSCAGDLTSSISVTGAVNVNVPGTYTRTYKATDNSGHTSTTTRTVEVKDTTVPALTLNNLTLVFPLGVKMILRGNQLTVGSQTFTLTSSTVVISGHTVKLNGASITIDGFTYTINGQTILLTPPNHQYVTINISDLVATASDGCDGDVNINNVVISRVTSDEAENSNGGDGNTLNDIVIAPNCRSVQLRSERSGSNNGRVYTLTLKVRDASGNATTGTAQVTVPKSLGFGPAVDDGPHYTVTSGCP
jgi:uncharacterized repeat protein (TIGR01451 family)